jgi:hypothetical protein
VPPRGDLDFMMMIQLITMIRKEQVLVLMSAMSFFTVSNQHKSQFRSKSSMIVHKCQLNEQTTEIQNLADIDSHAFDN